MKYLETESIESGGVLAAPGWDGIFGGDMDDLENKKPSSIFELECHEGEALREQIVSFVQSKASNAQIALSALVAVASEVAVFQRLPLDVLLLMVKTCYEQTLEADRRLPPGLRRGEPIERKTGDKS